MDLELPEDFDRLPRDMETATFRLVQECLTNIHRHSESPSATIGIIHANGEVRIEVQDHGKGIPPDKKLELLSAGTPGVGIRGMRERLRQLGGTLEIGQRLQWGGRSGRGFYALMPDLFRLENQSKADFDPRRARLLVTPSIQRLPFVRLNNFFRFAWTERFTSQTAADCRHFSAT